MKKILGLDLGTNSIGWALIEQDFENKAGKILGLGSRIIPMSQYILGQFAEGSSVSQTADRTKYRSSRRLRERYLLRRERLHRILNVMGFLPEHYASEIDFKNRLGRFFENSEPKLVYKNKQFLFMSSFSEMLEDFRKHQPQLLKGEKGEEKLIPYDWTIYYLRKKALTHKIQKEELAWLILNFNQKRGYYQVRGEEDEEVMNKLVEFHSLKITDVVAGEVGKNKSEIWYSLTLENGWIYRRASNNPLFDWKDKVRDFIVTTELNDDGTAKTNKEGEVKRSFRAPNEDDWTLLKKKTEQDIDKSHKTVGCYIYDALLESPQQKIKGRLIRTIERKFYRQELELILKKQKQYHPELTNKELYSDCVRELYRNNEAHQIVLSTKDLGHLLVNDIIFYQRPLKSKKSLISNCALESRRFKDSHGISHEAPLKGIAKSHPLYQEFRLWQWIYNLSIYRKTDDANVTDEFLGSSIAYENLYTFLNSKKNIEQKYLLKYFLEQKGLKGKLLSFETENYRWNYIEDKIYPCNETKALISSRLAKVENIADDFLTPRIENRLWHILYSVTDKFEYEKALKSFADIHKLHKDSFVEAFKRFPPFKPEHGSFSEKAIKKLLPLMRSGKYWDWDAIDSKTKDRIEKIISGEYDETIKDRVRERAVNLTETNHFQGLQVWLASYVVYDSHSEAKEASKWNSVSDLRDFLRDFRQHSLRNPIVEQVVNETLRTVADIWQRYGNGAKDYFDEIHIELGREMKNPSEERHRLTKQVVENENTNLRIKALLAELKADNTIENVRPYSPIQQEILKIYEDGVLCSNIEIPDDIEKISKTAQPDKHELTRYKLWLEQKYRSPYTGAIIPLSKLFTLDYEVEHVIPQSRFFDDSFSNKVLCETAINKLKDKQLGLEFIKNHRGQLVDLGFGRKIEVQSEESYRKFIDENYLKNRTKRGKLLLDEIPEKMVARQMNDTRYISKFISSLLSNLVREKYNDESFNSKNVIPGNGKITSTLKQDWGLNDVWNELIMPRFERLNEITQTTAFTAYSEKQQKYLPTVPIELSKGFQKKRIDHRHHALDALVIACATRNHINYLNNQHALDKGKTKEQKQNKREDLRAVLCVKRYNEGSDKNYSWQFKKPWDRLTEDARHALSGVVVSYKQNQRVINKATNSYEKWGQKNGAKVKIFQKQLGTNWAIRKPMHKETVFGKVELPWAKVAGGKTLTATRKSLDPTFNLDKIESITDTGIQKILRNYLKAKEGNAELAFSPEGIEDMNNNIRKYNDGKHHQSIYKVRIFEAGNKFQVGFAGNKKSKYVEAAQGTNLFYGVYQDSTTGKKSFLALPLNEVIERQKQGLNSVPDTRQNGEILLFYLSPNDLVYVPTAEEKEAIPLIDFSNLSPAQKKRLYNVNDFSTTCYFTPNTFAERITPKEVDLSFDKKKNKTTGSFDNKTASLDGIQIKDVCIKLKVDRLGNIFKA